MRRRSRASALALALALLLSAGATAQAQPRSITVVAGDTLEQLALRYGVSLQALIDANGISDPTLLQVGQVLKLPGRPAPAAADSAPPPPESRNGSCASNRGWPAGNGSTTLPWTGPVGSCTPGGCASPW